MTMTAATQTRQSPVKAPAKPAMRAKAANVTGNKSVPIDAMIFPLPPEPGDEGRFEMDVYVRFMRHIRQVPNSRTDIKILSAIQFTADMMDVADALVAKTLVDMGLRAPRRAFPFTFLDFADRILQREAWNNGAAPSSVMALRRHWDAIGEDRFEGSVTSHYAVFNQSFYTRA
jgi:hypothetical protein